jgi:hypothetical protein
MGGLNTSKSTQNPRAIIPPDLAQLRALLANYFKSSLPGQQFGAPSGSTQAPNYLLSLISGQPPGSFNAGATTGAPVPTAPAPAQPASPNLAVDPKSLLGTNKKGQQMPLTPQDILQWLQSMQGSQGNFR